MKHKQFDKKLVLNKKTISHLMQEKMGEIKGGITNTCYSEDPNATCTITIPPSLGGFQYTRCMYCVP
jgi:hypothetical protein